MRITAIVLIIAIFLGLTASLIAPMRRVLGIKLGYLIDQDIIYLKNGGVIKGCVKDVSADTLVVEIQGGDFRLTRKECGHIEENYILRIVKELI